MLTQVVLCVHCGHDDVVRNGRTSNGKQRLKCKGCGRSSREEQRFANIDELRAQLMRDFARARLVLR